MTVHEKGMKDGEEMIGVTESGTEVESAGVEVNIETMTGIEGSASLPHAMNSVLLRSA